ncbi:hypothetical protein BDZ94DRAFT_1230603 [Collybia nuda]|uniref:Uncharacterized protein n=1 Tax=Collybia nuda TaxID=64659 RepID=A0A9P5XS72_9AGAR|nr:hypothetical protein BDZ94DRAFT_1230603 [Collybia nuda]
MRSFATIITALVTFALVAPSVNAVIAWSGTACNGAQGNNVPCDGSCRSFDTRNHCITMYEGAGCPNGRFDVLYKHTFANQNGQCLHVNTGTPIKSFRCAPDNFCLA